MTLAIELDDLTLGYDRHPAVHHLSGRIAQGTLTAVIGPNGAGKSTLLKGIVGALPPLGGTLRFVGCDRRDIAYLPQTAEIDRSFPVTVWDFVAMGLWRRVGAFGGIGRGAAGPIATALETVGLEGFETRPIGTLSGGQMQRTLFARLLVQDTAVILLDEPFNAVDGRTVEDLLVLVERWHAEGRTVVAVLHDHAMVRRVFPDALLIAREPVAWGATGTVVTPDNLSLARRMIEAFDAGAPVCARDAA
ncbi:ABC transporter ATP-binding protein [Siculibacillus lacustris]|uniref:ABC transporter ATP-binding protein n=1 Tax=Siculibacillus lacustris TaxID=1549641 RepID=A0A4Q9VWP0_9HYPH|nr:ABC transporter ATP-binding protein [Siculibacillus lacustris]TBW40755.1 ABC transporter ATP-binding protein [Siculibacillus lacustris]